MNNPKNSLSIRKKQWITGILAIIICIAGVSYKQGANNFSTSKNSETEGSVEAIMVDIPVEDETKYPLSVDPTPPPVISETQTSKPNPVPSENNLPQNASLTELSCQELWKKRNQVFHDLGYCFKQENAKAIFDNTGCKFNRAEDIALSDTERYYVKSIRAIEENKGCLNKPSQIVNSDEKSSESQLIETSLGKISITKKSLKDDFIWVVKINGKSIKEIENDLVTFESFSNNPDSKPILIDTGDEVTAIVNSSCNGSACIVGDYFIVFIPKKVTLE